MRVDELRTTIAKYDENLLKELVVALYKVIPKDRKEDQGLDELIINFTQDKTKAASKNINVDFGALKDEIVQFLEYANEQYYFAPNRYVRKEKRSKWRFEVKRLIKELLAVFGENSEEAAQLLADIYAMLSYACNYYIFSTENPFSAVGYHQPELLRIALEKIFYSGFGQAEIKKAVFLTLDSNVDRDTLHETLLSVLVGVLKTSDTKEEAISQCVAYQKEYISYQNSKKLFKYPMRSDYRQGEHNNYAVELYLLLKFKLHEYDDGINYFWKNYIERDKEITLYYLLEFLDDDSLNSLWVREYEKAIKNSINPRKDLQNEYRKRKALV